jgi:hypothetical protein
MYNTPIIIISTRHYLIFFGLTHFEPLYRCEPIFAWRISLGVMSLLKKSIYERPQTKPITISISLSKKKVVKS